jgi:lipoprotein-releasing system permease protein
MIVEEKTLLQNGEIQTIVFLKGVDNQYTRVTSVANNLIRGKFELGTEHRAAIVLGSGIENALGLQSDRNLYPVTAYLFKRGVNINVVDPYQAFSAENVSTAGTFFIQQDLDNKYAITNLEFMKAMLAMKPNEFGSIEIGLKDEEADEQAKSQIAEIFGSGYVVETRYEQNKSLYSVMTLEKWAIYGILTLMLIVAAFTMIGALTMLVLEKQKDIQVLKALGADNSRIRRIFLTEGILLASMGSVAGLLLAILICWAQMKFELVAIEGGTFLIDHYPVELKSSDFVLVLVTVMVIAFFASWFPARKAALQPVELKS